MSSVKLMGARRRAGHRGEEAPAENVDQGTGGRRGDWTCVPEVSSKGILPETHTHTQGLPSALRDAVSTSEMEGKATSHCRSEKEKASEREREYVHTRERERDQRNTSELQM